MTLAELGWTSYFADRVTDEERAALVPARVIWEGRGEYRVSCEAGELRADLAGRLRHTSGLRADLPAVGDWVVVAARPAEGRATIQRVLPRRTSFSRKRAGRASDEQIIAANVDLVLLVTSATQDFNLRRLERYLALVWESGASPLVVVNKADLAVDPAAWREEAASAGVPVHVTSALCGDGLPELAAVVRAAGTTALVGSSGVGKSTLINRLLGGELQPVRPIRERDGRGRHSTTSRQLFAVPGGGLLLDTPGMRELHLWDAEAGLQHTFADIEDLADECRFRDCTHGQEPGCAVTRAVAEGGLDGARLESFRQLQRDEAFLEARLDEHARAGRTRRAKTIAKALRQQYKLRQR